MLTKLPFPSTTAVRATPLKASVSNSVLGYGGRKKRTVVCCGQLEQAIRALVPEIIRSSSDLDKLSVRDIRMALRAELGAAVDGYKELIEDVVDECLENKAAEAERAEEEQKKKVSEPPSGAGAKRKASLPATTPSQDMKSEAAGSGSFVRELSGSKRVSVAVFKGKVQVALREFYQDMSGEMKPGLKGISLTFDQWLLLKAQLPALVDAATSGRETGNEPVQLSSDRQAYVLKYQSKYLTHVREMYEKEGNLLPGKKGVGLDAEGVTKLLAEADRITAAAQKLGAKSENEGLPAASASQPGAAPAPAKKQAMRKNISTEASGTGESDAFVNLGSEKRATVSVFKGKTYVDLRQYYSAADGQKLPTKKGIMLSPKAFKLIAQNAGAISSAFASPNASYELELGLKVKVTVTMFKGKAYANVREYYEDKSDGEMKPGQKGMAMSLEHWNKLVAGLPHIEAKLGMPLV